MRLSAARELYGRAELRLRELLFGDGVYLRGGLRGEEPREQARAQIRRMRTAFDEVERHVKQVEDQPATELLDEARRRTHGARRPGEEGIEPGEAREEHQRSNGP